MQTIPSWEEVPGADGRHPPHTRLDPVAVRESLEQLVALGYIARPDDDLEKAVADAIDELRFNLAEAYQDADRHGEALEILRESHEADPNEQRYAVHRFVSCQALGRIDEMRDIVDDLDGRRRELYSQAQARLEELAELVRSRVQVLARPGTRTANARGEADQAGTPEEEEAGGARGGRSCQPRGGAQNAEAILNEDERHELALCQNLARFDPPVVDYLKAQVRATEGAPRRGALPPERVQEPHLARPGLFLQTARLFAELGRWDEAEQTYAKALSVDPDNPHAHVGMSRLALRRRDFAGAAQSALERSMRLYHYPMAHFLLGTALTGLRQFVRRRGVSHCPVAQSQLPRSSLAAGRLLRCLGDPVGAENHLRLFQEFKLSASAGPRAWPRPCRAAMSQAGRRNRRPSRRQRPVPRADLADTAVVVSGLPRSGTSMVMQMLAAGGLPVLTDDLRAADPDNPLGYFEFEPVRHLHENAGWLEDAGARAIKVVAPLLRYLPNGPGLLHHLHRAQRG